MKYFIYFCFLLISFNSLKAQKKVFYYDIDMECLADSTKAVHEFYSYKVYEKEDSSIYTSKTFRKDSSTLYTVPYVNKKKHGIVESFWPNGNKKRRDVFKNGEFVKGTVWNEKGKKIKHYPFEEMPEFPGGIPALFKFLGDNVVYPEDARMNGIEQTIYTQFIVDKEGNIIDIDYMRKEFANPLLVAEAIRVVKLMPNWIAGTQEGKPIKVQYTLPFRFKLEAKK